MYIKRLTKLEKFPEKSYLYYIIKKMKKIRLDNKVIDFLKNNHILVNSLTPLKNGISNLNYLVNDKYVIKVSYDNKFFSANEKTIEFQNMLYKENLSVQTIAIDRENSFLLTKYDPHLKELDFKTINLKNIKDLVKTIKKYKSFSFKLDELNYNQMLDSLRLKMDVNERLYFKKLEFSNLFNIEKENNHFDLVNNNIQINKFNSISIIDFDMANYSSKYFDLASLLSENKIFDNIQKTIIEEYFIDDENSKNFFMQNKDEYIAILDLLWFSWAKVRKKTAINELKQTFEDISKEKYFDLKQRLKLIS